MLARPLWLARTLGIYTVAVSHRGRVLPSERRTAFVQERAASQRPILRVQRTGQIEMALSPLANNRTIPTHLTTASSGSSPADRHRQSGRSCRADKPVSADDCTADEVSLKPFSPWAENQPARQTPMQVRGKSTGEAHAKLKPAKKTKSGLMCPANSCRPFLSVDIG